MFKHYVHARHVGVAAVAAPAFVFFLLCAFGAQMTAAQTTAQASSDAATVSGRVTDSSGAGLAGAVVTLYARDARPDVRLSTTADETGAYRFARLAAPREYVIEARAEGFAQAAARVVRVGREGAPGVDLQLAPAGVREEVVVTAADAPQPVDEVSKAVTVVGRAEIDERDEALIAEALRTVPGLRVQQLGGPGSLTSIKTRGLRNQDTSLLIDGLRFRDVAAPQGDATAFLSDLLATDVSRVEVLRGSGSSLYGTNAVGGVVNVVTEEGGGPFRGSLFAEGGGLGQARVRAQIAGGAGEADRVAYSAGVSHLNVSRGVDGDDATRNTNAQGRVLLRLTPTATLSARVYAGESYVQLNENPQGIGTAPANTRIVDARPLSREELRRFESGTSINSLNANGANFIESANDPDAASRGRFFSGAVTFAQRASESFGYSISYQGLATRRRITDGPDGPGDPADRAFFLYNEPAGNTRSDFEGRIHTLNARGDFRLGSFNFVTAGYEFERESFANRAFAAADPALDNSVNVAQRSHSLFAQDQIRLLDNRLQLSAGFRAQFFSLGRPRFEPAAGAPYAGLSFEAPPTAYTGDGSVSYYFRSTDTKLRAHVGNGYRAPSLYERFGTFFSSFSNSFSPLGDPRLRPDRSVAFDAGIDQTFASGRARASATYFYTRLQEVVGFGATPNDPFGRFFGGFINTGGGLARGAELSATLAPARSLDVFTSYTYTNSDQRRPQVGSVLQSLGIPSHQFTLVATQRVGPRFFVNLDFVASSSYLVGSIFDARTFANPVYRFDGIRKLDLGASYRLPLGARDRAVRFFGKIENLLDRDYYENGFRTPGRVGLAGAAFSF